MKKKDCSMDVSTKFSEYYKNSVLTEDQLSKTFGGDDYPYWGPTP